MLHYKTILPRIQEIKSMGYLIGIHLTGLNSDKEEFEKAVDLCDWIGLDFKLHLPSIKSYVVSIINLGRKHLKSFLEK